MPFNPGLIKIMKETMRYIEQLIGEDDQEQKKFEQRSANGRV